MKEQVRRKQNVSEDRQDKKQKRHGYLLLLFLGGWDADGVWAAGFTAGLARAVLRGLSGALWTSLSTT